MLFFASIVPHPPIIIPGIGSKNDLLKVKKTINGIAVLEKIFNKAGIDTAIIISPHGQIDFKNIKITDSPILSGNFSNFGCEKINLKFKNDNQICDKIKNECQKQKIPFKTNKQDNLDHGSLVPLYYLCQKSKPKIVPIAYSMLDNFVHLSFGKLLGKIAKKSSKKIGIIASGDLSHRLTPEAPAGYSSQGKKFDKKLIELLKNNDTGGILNMDKNFIEEAGQCGHRSILIMLGALSVLSNFKFEIISYEGPFGVGYLVANTKIS